MNERDIANGFTAVWSELFPMLSPTFIVAFNEGFVRPVFGRTGIVPQVPLSAKTQRPDVLAEFGFRLAAAAILSNVSARTVAADKSILDEAYSAAVSRIHEFRPEVRVDDLHLTELEKEEGIRLAAVYDEFLTMWPGELVAFSPTIKGSGILRMCTADLEVGRTLFEVKTVSRPFHSRDLRQLLVYLILQSATGDRRWENAGLFNPRLGVFCKFNVDWLVTRLSGGRPPKIVFMDFVQALARDAVLDHRF